MAVTALAPGAVLLFWCVVFLVHRIVHVRRRRRFWAEREARLAREDAAWRLWCDAASRAVRMGCEVPPWRKR